MIQRSVTDQGEYFIVPMEDSSMERKGIKKHDELLVRRQKSVEDGEIAVIRIGKQKPLVRSVVERGFELFVYSYSLTELNLPKQYDTDKEDIHIIGKVVKVISEPCKPGQGSVSLHAPDGRLTKEVRSCIEWTAEKIPNKEWERLVCGEEQEPIIMDGGVVMPPDDLYHKNEK